MKFLFSLFVFLVFVDLSFAQDSAFRFSASSWDFGVIDETDGRVSHRFTFTNFGSEPVVIERVSASCGCTTSDYTRTPVGPGDRGFVSVVFDPANGSGAFRKTVTIVSGGGKNSNVLIIKGIINPRPLTVPEKYPFAMRDGMRFSILSVDMSRVPHGRPARAEISYVNTGARPVSLSFSVSPADSFLFLPRSVEISGGSVGSFVATLIVPPGARYGVFSYRIRPVINGLPEALAFTLSGTLIDDLAAVDLLEAPRADLSPVFFDFGDLRRGATVTKEITLRNSGHAALIVRHAASQTGLSTDLKPGTTIPPGAQATFKATLDTAQADKNDNLFIRTLTIITNDPQSPIKELRLAAKMLSGTTNQAAVRAQTD